MVKNIEQMIMGLDNSLVLVEEIGEGTFSKVFKVSKQSKPYALKVERRFLGIDELPHHLKREKFGITGCGYEFGVQKTLSGIEGVPEAVFLYNEDAFLMQYIDGKTIKQAGKQPIGFFDKLRRIASGINDRGYCLPMDLVFGNNLLADEGHNPYVVDFMLSERLNDGNRSRLHALDQFAIDHLQHAYST